MAISYCISIALSAVWRDIPWTHNDMNRVDKFGLQILGGTVQGAPVLSK